MASEINLLPELVAEEKRKGVYKQKINVIALISLLVVGVIIVGFFAYQFGLSLFLKNINARIENAQSEILDSAGKEITHRALVEKLNIADSFISGRTSFSAGFEKLLGVLNDSGIILKNSEFKKDGGVTITVNAATSDNIGKFVNAITASSLAKTFSEIMIVDLKKEADKPFTLIVDFKYLKGEATSSATTNK